jgi:endoglycosylceramidase
MTSLEPWAGNIYKKPSLLLPGVAGSNNLQPLYDVIASAIREVDEEHIVMYEPVTWGYDKSSLNSCYLIFLTE